MDYFNYLYLQYFKCIKSLRLPYLSQLNLNESILLSWPFVILGSIYTLLATVIFSGGDLSHWSVLFVLASSGLSAILFPLSAYLFYLVWKLSLSLYFSAMDVESYKADRIISTSFSSYTFLSIPIIGSIFQSGSQFYLLYKNVKFELGISPFKTVLIVITPLIIKLFLFFALVMTTFSLLLVVFKF